MAGAVDSAAAAGARLIVSPNADPAVIERALKLGLVVLPGVATPTEAFAAQSLGASGLKLFPAEAMPPEVVKAWRSVLPKETPLFPVGGITPERMAAYRKAGADGFGIGGALYRAGMTAAGGCAEGQGVRAGVEGRGGMSRRACGRGVGVRVQVWQQASIIKGWAPNPVAMSRRSGRAARTSLSRHSGRITSQGEMA